MRNTRIFLSENFHFLVVKFSIYLNRHVFVMCNLKCLSGQVLVFQTLDHLGPVVQSVVSLTSLLRVISLTILADSIYNILIFFAEKM